MTSFGLITEGITDQIVVENILIGYFDDLDLIVNPVQPPRDETNRLRTVTTGGGWTQVFEHCKPETLGQVLSYNDYVVIQIDTDVCDDPGYDISKLEVGTGRELPPDELIENVREKLRELIGTVFYSEYAERIIFAIAVHMTECWLLPLYYDDTNRARFKGCLDILNRALSKKGEFTISAKNPEYYESVSRKYLKKKVLTEKYKENPSLQIFIEELENLEISV